MNKDDVYVELTETVDRIGVYFKYDEDDVKAIKSVRGKRGHFENGRFKHWSVPMSMEAARTLRLLFNDRMQLGPAVRAWAKEQVKVERNMRQLNAASDAELEHTPQIILDVIAGRKIDHPLIPRKHALRRTRDPRPYQRADIKMMSLANVGNFNDVGTGKTIEVIGAIHEAELQNKPILVIAPRRSLVNVWEKEFKLWSEISLLTSESPGVRKNYMRLFAEDGSEAKGAIALIADDLRLEKSYDIKDQMILGEEMAERVKSPLFACKDYRGNWYDFKSEIQRDFFQIEWGTFVIDEFHQIGLPNRKSLFSLAAGLIQAERKWPLSGTPIGGKPRRLWPILNFMYPKQYTSEWRWIDDFLEVTEEEYFIKGGHGRKRVSRSVGGIKPGTDEHFWNSHRHHMVRRTKKDALPGLPDAVEIIVDTPMTGRQLNDYIRFDEEHEIILEGGGRMTGSIVLSQYTRLRQLANSCMTFLHDERDPSKRDRTRPIATTPSNKLEYLIERLDENGIRKNDFEPGARAYVGVNDKSFLTITIDALKKAGIDCDRLDGDTKDSAPILKKFHGDQERPYVVAMTIATGGTSLDFGRANSAHALDENWDPDVMTQFFGRGDRGARETPLRCYTYRTPESIQEYVAEVAADKVLNNKTVLAIAKDIEALRRGR